LKEQEFSMADQKNEAASSGSQNKSASANEGVKSVQSGTLASHTSRPLGGQVTDRPHTGDQDSDSQKRSALTETAKERAGELASNVRDTMGNVKEKAGEALEEASGWAEDTYGRVSDWASEVYDSQGERLDRIRQQSSQSARRVRGGLQDYVSENPMVVGLVGLAAGMLIGALLPRTRRENEVFGEWADELRHQGVRYAREATQRGRELVEETFEGEDPRFSKHDSEFKPSRQGANRH
jgi:ElaB/YqjD/DUF883 family membrane-anchored ribosome-binding protein